MILLDQVTQAREPLVIADPLGEHIMPGCAERAAAVAACALRLVLDGSALDACVDLARSVGPFVRMPAEQFWTEWTEPGGLRTGLLVTGDASGRRGIVESFWEQPGGEPLRAQADVAFDFDHAVRPQGTGEFALNPGEHPLAPHLLIRVGSAWARHFGQDGADGLARAAADLAAEVVPGVAILCALAALLAARGALATDAVERERINRQRARRGSAPLLDHLHVRLDLAGHAGPQAGSGTGEAREAARLHQVRGHFVARDGRVFWRRPHLRGTPAATPLRRTVLVTR